MKKNPIFRNQAGFTLIETMASLAILSLVIVLASGFLLNANTKKESTSANIELQHKTNVLVTGMEKIYYDQVGTGDLAFQLPSDGVAIQKLLVNGNLTEIKSPLTNIDFESDLSIDVTTVTPEGQTLTIQTSWRPIRDDTRTLAPQP